MRTFYRYLFLLCFLLGMLACRQPTLGPQETGRLMFALLSQDTDVSSAALSQIGSSGEQAFAPLLIDMLWISGSELSTLRDAELIASTLSQLTGQDYGTDWEAWVNWYAASDIVAPDGIAEWKGAFFGRIDSDFSPFFASAVADGFRPEEVVWGGVRVDGIPPLEQLAQVSSADAQGISRFDAVFGLSINGDHRAYPLRIMDWHEMANDVVGGVPVSIAYCTLCGAAVAYQGSTPSGATYDFGSSGLLYRSNKLMYDRQTRSLWNQLTGEPVLGEAVERGETLTVLPIVLTSWGEWLDQHPDSTVLPLDTGVFRDYSAGAAYGEYFVSEKPLFPVGLVDERLPPKTQVFALRVNGQPKAYPLAQLVRSRVTNDVVGDVGVVLVSAEKAINVHGYSYELEYISYSAGARIQAYESGTHTFTQAATPDTLLDQDGNRWTITTNALLGPSGQQLNRLGGHLAYWFGWYAAHPNTLLYTD